jgi:hypothetical protein
MDSPLARGCTTRRTSTTPAASASWRTSAGRSRTTLVHQGIQVLENLEHRGACGCDPETGDGAGILIQLPDRFLRREAERLGIVLPRRAYAVGHGLPLAPTTRCALGSAALLRRSSPAEGQRVLGWRDVPVTIRRRSGASPARRCRRSARSSSEREPDREDAFERKLYVIRRLLREGGPGAGRILLRAEPLAAHDRVRRHADGRADRGASTRSRPIRRMESALALVHSRYSTNTLPTWDLATALPLSGSQRGDQYAEGQPELDARARGHAALGDVRRRPPKALSHHEGRRERLGAVRQRARVPEPDGPRASRGDPDDDPGGVGEPGRHGPGSQAPSTSTTPS